MSAAAQPPTVVARRSPRRALAGPLRIVLAGVVAFTIASTLLTGNLLPVFAMALLCLAWKYLRGPEGPPVLALAFSFQWVQVNIGMFYSAFIDTRFPVMFVDSYYETLLLANITLAVMFAGFVEYPYYRSVLREAKRD